MDHMRFVVVGSKIWAAEMHLVFQVSAHITYPEYLGYAPIPLQWY